MKNTFVNLNLCSASALICMLLLNGCKQRNPDAPKLGENIERPKKTVVEKHSDERDEAPAKQKNERPMAAPKNSGGDPRRLLFAQIVEDAESRDFTESGIIEGAPYKWFLKQLVGVSHDQIRKQTNDQIGFEHLMAQPGMYRGQVVTLPRAVVIEASQAELPPEYGLPAGYSVVLAVAIDSARDVYALRILCPPNSTLFEKLFKGISDDSLPVVRISGYFMKLYARKTARQNDMPWRRPLLICPEPEFSQGVPARHYERELIDSGNADLLPSGRLDLPSAEERMVIEVRRGENDVRIDGKRIEGDLAGEVHKALGDFKKRLPPEQVDHPAVVILVSSGADRKWLDSIVAALRSNKVQRIAIKSEK